MSVFDSTRLAHPIDQHNRRAEKSIYCIHQKRPKSIILFCTSSLPQASTRWVHFQATVHFPPSSIVDSPWQLGSEASMLTIVLRCHPPLLRGSSKPSALRAVGLPQTILVDRLAPKSFVNFICLDKMLRLFRLR